MNFIHSSHRFIHDPFWHVLALSWLEEKPLRLYGY